MFKWPFHRRPTSSASSLSSSLYDFEGRCGNCSARLDLDLVVWSQFEIGLRVRPCLRHGCSPTDAMILWPQWAVRKDLHRVRSDKWVHSVLIHAD